MDSSLDDKALMREFYKSGASNYAAFKKAKLNQSNERVGSPVSTGSVKTPATAPTSSAPAAAPNAAPREQPSISEAASAPAVVGGAKNYAQAAKAAPKIQPAAKEQSVKEQTTLNSTLGNTSAIPSANRTDRSERVNANTSSVSKSSVLGPSKEQPIPSDVASASQEYIAFIKQHQDLQKCHHKLDEILKQYEKDRQECQGNVSTIRDQAVDLLKVLEKGTNWNLVSKYTIQTLIKDAKLDLQPRELFQPDDKPKYLDIMQQQGNLENLQRDNSKREPFQDFKILFENGARKLERAEKEVKTSQLDAQNIARLPDTLFIQLDHILSAPTITEILEDVENRLEDLIFKLEDTKAKREQAMEDGEMPRAEEYCNDEVRYLEGIMELIIDKLRTTERTKNESQVFDKVREQYQKKAMDDMMLVKSEKEELKRRCEADMRRIFSLKEKVDSVEAQTVHKLQQEQEQSEKLLVDNADRTKKAWETIQKLEDDLKNLELERYQEVKKRVATKEKDETRKMEYERFCQIVDKHTSLLDLTVKNCETAIHVITLLGEFVASGFTTLGNYLNKCDDKYNTLQLNTHKQHLEFFQGLYLSLGELIHKKEKKIEEIDREIQTNHIQHELAIDTLNPTAKKYSDNKKQLLFQRDAVERELRELREKAQNALSNFQFSDEALHAAGVPFTHPVIVQREQELELRAKMVEYKAISIGRVDVLPIQQELADLKRQFDETRSVLSMSML